MKKRRNSKRKLSLGDGAIPTEGQEDTLLRDADITVSSPEKAPALESNVPHSDDLDSPPAANSYEVENRGRGQCLQTKTDALSSGASFLPSIDRCDDEHQVTGPTVSASDTTNPKRSRGQSRGRCPKTKKETALQDTPAPLPTDDHDSAPKDITPAVGVGALQIKPKNGRGRSLQPKKRVTKKSLQDLMKSLEVASAQARKIVAEAEGHFHEEYAEAVEDNSEASEPPAPSEEDPTNKGRKRGRSATASRKQGRSATASRKRKREADSSGCSSLGTVQVPEEASNEAVQSANATTHDWPVGGVELDTSYLDNSSQENSWDGDDDDEDDIDLLDPGLTPNSKAADRIPDFAADDVVFAICPKTKTYWPSVITGSNGEELSRLRYYTVVKVTASQDQCSSPFKCRPRTIKPFSSKAKTSLLAQGQGSLEFRRACDIADDFLRKIGLGKVSSYTDFLHQQKTAYLDSPPASPDTTCPLSPNLLVGHGNLQDASLSSNHLDDDEDDDEEDDEDEGGSESGQEGTPSTSQTNVSPTCKNLKLEKKWKLKEDRVIKHIKKEQTLEYLFKIQREEIKSDRHKYFLSNNPRDKSLLRNTSLGALFTDEKQWDLLGHLRARFEDQGLVSSPSYMMEVAIPEALNLAYRKIKRVSRKRAEEILRLDGQQVIQDLGIG